MITINNKVLITKYKVLSIMLSGVDASIYIVLCVLCLALNTQNSFAQNLGVNATGSTPNASSIIDLNTGNTFTSPNGKGILPPNVALTGITDAITVTSPATSLLVYNTATANIGTVAVVPGYYYWDGAKWVRLQTTASTAPDWSLLGNAGTTAGTNFIGTTDAQDLVLKTNGVENMRILNSSGNVGIGTTTPSAKLESGNGSIADAIMGTVGGGYAGKFKNVNLTYGAGGKLLWISSINQNAGSYHIYTEGNNVPEFVVTGIGNVGIGTASPFAKLHIDGTAGELLRLTSSGFGTLYMGTDVNQPWIGTSTNNDFRLVANGISYVYIKPSGNVGINNTAPATKLSIVATATNTGFQLQDGSEGSGKVLTSDATGKASWQTSSGSLLSTQIITAQSIPPFSTTVLSGFSYTIPSAKNYKIEFRCWNTFTGGTIGSDVAQHVRLLKNGIPIDQFENYNVLGSSTRNTTFFIMLHASGCLPGDVLTLDFRPGIPAGATSIDFNTGNIWTTSKVLVFPE